MNENVGVAGHGDVSVIAAGDEVKITKCTSSCALNGDRVTTTTQLASSN